MKCAICAEETLGRDQVKWGPEFAHRTCVTAFNTGVQDEREACGSLCHQRYMELEHGADSSDPFDDYEAGMRGDVARGLRDAIKARSNFYSTSG